MTITAIIVDDEPLARTGLQALVDNTPGFHVVATCADGTTALDAILGHMPDVVLLDVQMPGLDGVEVARRLGPERTPYIVFVTAFDEFTIDAFELHALDYVLKPYTDERLRASLARAAEAVRTRALTALGERVSAALAELGATRPELDGAEQPVRRLALRSARSVKYVDIGDVTWIEAQTYYVRVHFRGKSLLHRESMQSLARRLDRRFMRVHRSAIVRLDAVVELRRSESGDATAVLRDGTLVPVSRSRASATELRLRGD